MVIKVVLLLPVLILLFLPFDNSANSIFSELLNRNFAHLIIFFPALLVYQSTILCFPFEPSIMKTLNIQGLLAILFTIISFMKMYNVATNYGNGGDEQKSIFILYIIPVYVLAFAVWSILL